jgi:NTE family protein
MRGLAHLGVLQALEEIQIPVGAMAGTSMGGLVAGLYAAGVPVGDLIAFSTKLGLMDLASRDRERRGLFGHAKMARLLAGLLGSPDMSFEQCRIPVAVVATDVERGEMVILDHGPLIPALMATAAFPLVFAPMRHDGRWLVDGGVLNNFPVDIVRHMGADRVIGVNVPPDMRLSLDNPGAAEQSGRGLFRNRRRAWGVPFRIAEASSGLTSAIVTRTRLERCPPDLLLEVRLPNVGVFTTHRSAETIAAGYQLAVSHRDELLALQATPLPRPWQRRLGHEAADPARLGRASRARVSILSRVRVGTAPSPSRERAGVRVIPITRRTAQ